MSNNNFNNKNNSVNNINNQNKNNSNNLNSNNKSPIENKKNMESSNSNSINNYNKINNGNDNNDNNDKSNNNFRDNDNNRPKYFTVNKKNYKNKKRNNNRYNSNNYKNNSSNYSNNYSNNSFINNDSEYNKIYDNELKNKEYTESELEDIQIPITSFEDLEIDNNIIRGIYSHGFEQPSAIQCKAIKPFLSGKDIIAQAQSGMGKTGAFCIGTLGRINPENNAIQAIILSHTRELAIQTENVFNIIGKYTKTRLCLCIKGINIQENINNLTGKNGKNKPHIIIGTPGRVLDMLNRKYDDGNFIINVLNLRTIVIDEADEILSTTTQLGNNKYVNQDSENQNNIGFKEQTYKIFKSIPNDIQVCLFSATMNNDFFEMTEKFMRKPINVLVKSEELTLEGIKQYYINVEHYKYKFDTLCELYGLVTINQSMIYCNSLKSVEYLTRNLKNNNFMVSYIHGKMSPIEREETMKDFRNGKSRVLVSTDLLSRGIDVQQVSVVINYDIPSNIQSYLHRIGRSGRYGRKGVAINFMTSYDEYKMKEIENYYQTQIEPLPADINNLLN